MTGSTIESPVTRPRQRPPRIAPILIVVLIVGGVAAWYFSGRRRLVFSNELAAPIWLAVAQRAPGDAPTGDGSNGGASLGSVVVQWNLARPLFRQSAAHGRGIAGLRSHSGKTGIIRRSATIRESGTAYFAPLITNASQELLRITTNAGLEGAVIVAAPSDPEPAGSLSDISALPEQHGAARDSTGRTATFRDLGPRVTAADGTIGLRFEAKDFR